MLSEQAIKRWHLGQIIVREILTFSNYSWLQFINKKGIINAIFINSSTIVMKICVIKFPV